MKLFPLLVPAGNDSEVQFNNNGVFGGDSALTFNDATKVLASTGTIDGSEGKVRVTDNGVGAPSSQDDGYVGVAMVGGTARVYFAVEGGMYYIDGTATAVPAAGNPIGLLLALTYAA